MFLEYIGGKAFNYWISSITFSYSTARIYCSTINILTVSRHNSPIIFTPLYCICSYISLCFVFVFVLHRTVSSSGTGIVFLITLSPVRECLAINIFCCCWNIIMNLGKKACNSLLSLSCHHKGNITI